MTNPREREIAAQILRAYQLSPVEIGDRQMGYRNRSYPALLADGQRANVIIYKSDADILMRIRSANHVGAHLATAGLPVRRPLDPRIIHLQSGERVKYAAVYNYLPGHTIPWEGYTQKHLKLLGWSLGRLHSELQTAPHPANLPTAVNEYRDIIRRMQIYLGQPAVAHALQAKLGLQMDAPHLSKLDDLLNVCDRLPHQQILHLDFVRSNILFGQAAAADEFQMGSVALTGILDFEKTAWGHPVFDLARTLAFLQVDCKYKPEAKIRKYFLHSGYSKRAVRPLPPTHLLERLVTLFLTYDFYKFLRHNPYESLPMNEHFVRTRDLLLQRSLITPAPTPRFAPKLAQPL